MEDGLAGNAVMDINEDNEGNILFGTNRGLSVYNGEFFKNYNYTDGAGNGYISSIEVDGSNIWLADGNGSLTVFNGRKFKTYTDKDGFNGNYIYDIEIVEYPNTHLYAELELQFGSSKSNIIKEALLKHCCLQTKAG